MQDFVLEFGSFLLKSNALQFGVFRLASGKESPYYIDLRMLPSFPDHFSLAIHALKNTVLKVSPSFDSFASVPTSGLVFCSALAYEMVKPAIYVRKESREHGTSKVVEGYLKPGDKVVIIDDVATTGISISNAVAVIRTNGGIVENSIALVSRLEGAGDKLKGIKVKLTAVTTIKDIANALYKAGLIGGNTVESVLKQVVDVGEYETD